MENKGLHNIDFEILVIFTPELSLFHFNFNIFCMTVRKFENYIDT